MVSVISFDVRYTPGSRNAVAGNLTVLVSETVYHLLLSPQINSKE